MGYTVECLLIKKMFCNFFKASSVEQNFNLKPKVSGPEFYLELYRIATYGIFHTLDLIEYGPLIFQVVYNSQHALATVGLLCQLTTACPIMCKH